MNITFGLPHLFSTSSNEVEDAAVLCELVEALARIDQLYLRHHPRTPSIYKSGIVYGRTQDWITIPACIDRGYADCKSVTAWRLAELRMRGLSARPVHRWVRRTDGAKDYHILVQHPDKWEDPSKILGMGKNENAYFAHGEKRLPQRRPVNWNAHFRRVS